MSAPLIFLAIEIAAIVCAALLGGRVLASQPRLRSAWLIALIALSMASGVLLGHQDYGAWVPPAFRIQLGGWTRVLDLTRNLAPGLFMLLCFTLFTEGRRFPRALLGLLALQLCLDEPGRALIPATSGGARLATQTAPALLQALFAGFAFYWTLADWRFDLVEMRRTVRALTLTVGAGLIIATGLLTQVLIDPNGRSNFLVHEGLTLADLAILAFVLFQVTNGDTRRYLDFGARPAGRAPAPAAAADPAPHLERLMRLIEEERICEQEGLTLARLADRVGLPEYRLRKLIHEELGYRNFNALLHDHRIREACRRLGDPDQRRTPILTIALSVGYASINTFNRGFRERTGVTPSAWREARLAAGGRREGGSEEE
jgi:AraC-like DNA-binding protein